MVFWGKVLLLQAAGVHLLPCRGYGASFYRFSLLMLVALSRMGSSLFWAVQDGMAITALPAPIRRWWPVAALLAAGPALMLFGQPLIDFTIAAAGPLPSTAILPLWR